MPLLLWHRHAPSLTPGGLCALSPLLLTRNDVRHLSSKGMRHGGQGIPCTSPLRMVLECVSSLAPLSLERAHQFLPREASQRLGVGRYDLPLAWLAAQSLQAYHLYLCLLKPQPHREATLLLNSEVEVSPPQLRMTTNWDDFCQRVARIDPLQLHQIPLCKSPRRCLWPSSRHPRQLLLLQLTLRLR